MLKATFRPLTQWPGPRTPNGDRRRAVFRAGYDATLKHLERELAAIDASSVVIQIDLPASQIRVDGWPRSGARPASPGVVLSFVSGRAPLAFPCDRFLVWQDNLRAIALSLEALRAVNRYGVTRHAEQYRGFAQIEEPVDNVTTAAAFLSRHSGGMLVKTLDRGSIDAAYRAAAKRLHPDAPNGSHELFLKLQSMKAILEAGL